MHIISDLVLGMEGELSHVPEETPNDSEEKNDDSSENAIRFGELEAFDSITAGKDVSSDQDLIEQADQEWFTHHLSASVQRDDSNPQDHGQGF